MTDDNGTDNKWWSSSEAARFLGTDEQFVINMIASDLLAGCKEDDHWLVDPARLKKYDKNRKKLPMNVLQIYRGAQEVLLTQYHALFARAQAPHEATRGALYEQLIRDFLSEYLPQQFYVGTGQVVGSTPSPNPEGEITNVSRQTDVVIFDALHHPILLPKYELFPIEGTLATIEVKSKLGKSELVGDKKSAGALKNIASVKSLGSWERDQPLYKGEQVQPQPLDKQRPLGIVLAFEAGRSPKTPKTLLGYWRYWNDQCKWEHRTEMICILKQNLLLIDTSRVDQFFDPHQLGGNPWPSNKLVAFQSEYMFAVFFTLLLRRLRVRSAITQDINETTPMSYLREISWKIVAQVDVSNNV